MQLFVKLVYFFAFIYLAKSQEEEEFLEQSTCTRKEKCNIFQAVPLAHPSKCNFYYVCNHESLKWDALECPHSMYFDYLSLTCVDYKYAQCHPGCARIITPKISTLTTKRQSIVPTLRRITTSTTSKPPTTTLRTTLRTRRPSIVPTLPTERVNRRTTISPATTAIKTFPPTPVTSTFWPTTSTTTEKQPLWTNPVATGGKEQEEYIDEGTDMEEMTDNNCIPPTPCLPGERIASGFGCRYFLLCVRTGGLALTTNSTHWLRKSCPKNQGWDLHTQGCRPITAAQCLPPCITRWGNLTCNLDLLPCRLGSILPDTTKCDRYFACNGREWVPKRCPKNQKFDVFLQRCIAGDTACATKCNSSDSCMGTIPCTPGSIIPHPKQCSYYISCGKNGNSWSLKRCGKNASFDVNTTTCLQKQNGGQCATSCKQYQAPPTTIAPTTDPSATCRPALPCDDNQTAPDMFICNRYFLCLRNKWSYVNCPKGYLFDRGLAKCVVEAGNFVDCAHICSQVVANTMPTGNITTPPSPQCKPSVTPCVFGMTTPDPLDCGFYYQCTGNSLFWLRRKCPKNAFYDKYSNTCVVNGTRNFTCETDCGIFNSLCKLPLPCIPKMKIPVVNSCKQYAKCAINGKNWRMYTCPNLTLFNKDHLSCGIEASCATSCPTNVPKRSDCRPQQRCNLADQIYNPNNCNTFYQCDYNRSSLKWKLARCNSDQSYDHVTEDCLSDAFARCGVSCDGGILTNATTSGVVDVITASSSAVTTETTSNGPSTTGYASATVYTKRPALTSSTLTGSTGNTQLMTSSTSQIMTTPTATTAVVKDSEKVTTLTPLMTSLTSSEKITAEISPVVTTLQTVEATTTATTISKITSLTTEPTTTTVSKITPKPTEPATVVTSHDSAFTGTSTSVSKETEATATITDSNFLSSTSNIAEKTTKITDQEKTVLTTARNQPTTEYIATPTSAHSFKPSQTWTTLVSTTGPHTTTNGANIAPKTSEIFGTTDLPFNTETTTKISVTKTLQTSEDTTVPFTDTTRQNIISTGPDVTAEKQTTTEIIEVTTLIPKTSSSNNNATAPSVSVCTPQISGSSLGQTNKMAEFICECYLTSTNLPVIQWFWNDIVIEGTSNRIRISDTSDNADIIQSLLRFNPLKVTDSGAISCTARRQDMVKNSTQLELTVFDLPEVEISPMTLTVQNGDAATFSCRATSSIGDKAPTITWFQDGVLVPKTSAKVTLETAQSLLTISRISADFTVTCNAENNAGKTTKAVSILVVSTTEKSCPQITENSITWFLTKSGQTDRQKCATPLVGIMTRKCEVAANEEAVWEAEVDFTQCASPLFETIDIMLERMEDGIGSENDDSYRTVIGAIYKMANTSKSNQDEAVLPGDLVASTTVLQRLKNIRKGERKKIPEAELKAVTETVSRLLLEKNDKSWTSVLKRDEMQGVNLMEVLDEYVEMGADEPMVIRGNNLALEVDSMPKSRTRDVLFPTQKSKNFWSNRDKIELEKKTLDSITPILRGDRISVIGAHYKTLNKLLPVKIVGAILASRVISLSIAGLPENTILDPPIKFSLSHVVLPANGTYESKCSFWDYAANDWSQKGCFTKFSNASMTDCTCNHLTNFAILMAPHRATGANQVVLSMISMIGCIISIVALVVAVAVYAFLWKYIKSHHSTVLLNLCVCLILANVTFLAGVDKTEPRPLCVAMAGLLHYFYLAAFFIMLAEGILLLIYVVFVFYSRSLRTRHTAGLLIASWIVPAVIVAITMAVTQTNGYGNTDACWLNPGPYVWVFIGPVLFVITVNIAIILAVVCRIYRSRQRISANSGDDSSELKQVMWTVIVILPVTGVTWLFGVFSVNEETVVFQYIFTIFNSFQGLFIFILQCVLNRKVRKAFVTIGENKNSSSKSKSLKASSNASRYNTYGSSQRHHSNSGIKNNAFSYYDDDIKVKDELMFLNNKENHELTSVPGKLSEQENILRKPSVLSTKGSDKSGTGSNRTEMETVSWSSTIPSERTGSLEGPQGSNFGSISREKTQNFGSLSREKPQNFGPISRSDPLGPQGPPPDILYNGAGSLHVRERPTRTSQDANSVPDRL